MLKRILVSLSIAAIAGPTTAAPPAVPPAPKRAPSLETGRAEAASRQAFLAAYTVFMHPRCMNCHPAGDRPLQGDDSRPHAQNVKRGGDGGGKYALKCGNCHQQANLPGENMPPGSPVWHLLSPRTPMVFQGKTPGELARQLKDPEQNGGKTLEMLLHHVEKDALVLWGWSPGESRTTPPLSHAEFVAAMREWIAGGAATPDRPPAGRTPTR